MVFSGVLLLQLLKKKRKDKGDVRGKFEALCFTLNWQWSLEKHCEPL